MTESIQRRTLVFTERTIANLRLNIDRVEGNANPILVQQCVQQKEMLEIWLCIYKALLKGAHAPEKQLESSGI